MDTPTSASSSVPSSASSSSVFFSDDFKTNLFISFSGPSTHESQKCSSNVGSFLSQVQSQKSSSQTENPPTTLEKTKLAPKTVTFTLSSILNKSMSSKTNNKQNNALLLNDSLDDTPSTNNHKSTRIVKNKKKWHKFKPKNLKLVLDPAQMNLEEDDQSSDHLMGSDLFSDTTPATDTNPAANDRHPLVFNASGVEITSSGKYVYENLKIGSQGIEQMPASFFTQSQSVSQRFSSMTPLTDTHTLESSIFDTHITTSEVFNSPPRHPKTKTAAVDFKNLRLKNHLGSGASSTVDLVTDASSNKEYAVKRISMDSNFDPSMIKSELRALYKCRDSPHIVKFYNASYHDSRVSIVLEYMNGNSLEDVLKEKKSIPEDVLGHLTLSVLKGLHFLHSKHIVHRDIKPANILVSTSGVVKISDFGLTGSSRKGFGPKNPHVFNSCKGTIIYMSPERIEEATHSFNCDVWSLGVTLAELRAGKFPFDAQGTYFDVLFQIKGFCNVNLDPKVFSPGLTSFIADCCKVRPEERPSSSDLLNHPWLQPFIVAAGNSRKVISSFLRK